MDDELPPPQPGSTPPSTPPPPAAPPPAPGPPPGPPPGRPPGTPPAPPGYAPPGYGQPPPPPPPGYAPQGYGQPPYGAPAYGQQYGPPRSEGLAVAALVVSIVGLFVCGVVLGIVALVLAHQASQKIVVSGGALTGQGMVTAARIIAIVSIVLNVFFVAILVTAN